MKIFLAGQQTLANRGCEALVVSTIQMLSDVDPDVHFYIPSTDIDRDRRALAKYPFANYTFVSAPTLPTIIRVWNRFMRYAPAIATAWVPEKMDWSEEAWRALCDSDRVLHIGGDNFSYDYSYAGLVSNTAQIDQIAKLGKRQEIWCATVGPFSSCPPLERRVIEKLKKLQRVSVREPESKSYLEAQGIPAILTGDPAFSLPIHPESEEAVTDERPRIVLNVSPYVYRGADVQVIENALRGFVERRLGEGYRILLLSHVNTGTSSDTATMQKIFADYIEQGRVETVSEDLTASQFKGVVAASDFVVAVRTHVTIAGFSSATPTLSVGYSAKAPRLNRFLFGHDDYVVETPALNASTLEDTFQKIAQEKQEIRRTLESKSAELRADFRTLCEGTIAD